MRSAKTGEVISKLKAVRRERGLSLQRIQDMVLDAGGNISLATVKRVFADGSEEMNFRYEDSIQPIARVLLLDEPEPTATEADALQALVELKNSIIEENKAEAKKKIDFLKAQLARSEKLLDERAEYLRTKDRYIRLFITLAIMGWAFSIVLLGFDAMDIHSGFTGWLLSLFGG